jgi:hypothetical protein
MTKDKESDLGRFNAALRKMLSVPREEILKRDEEWKRKRAEAKRAKTSPASRASAGKG